ncbi:MAG: hypothetical protein JOS17DRAFT_460799 [Linnemannia elongata]|nr:MAG: hypothetical protein JOS17DRAFT_460799 [Linnemannia elongata]
MPLTPTTLFTKNIVHLVNQHRERLTACCLVLLLLSDHKRGEGRKEEICHMVKARRQHASISTPRFVFFFSPLNYLLYSVHDSPSPFFACSLFFFICFPCLLPCDERSRQSGQMPCHAMPCSLPFLSSSSSIILSPSPFLYTLASSTQQSNILIPEYFQEE